MTPVSFSRFFKLRTGKSLSDYIIDIRLGHATRQLVDSTKTVAEICYECGFNNLSNFNRIFKKKKGCSPKEFREIYYKKKDFCLGIDCGGIDFLFQRKSAECLCGMIFYSTFVG